MGVFVHLLLRNPRTDEQKLKQRNRTILSIYDNLIADNITLLFLILFYITVTLPGRKSDTVTSQGRMPGTRRVVVQFPFRRLQKRRRRAPYPSLSFHFRNKHFVKLFWVPARFFPTNQLRYDHWTNLVDEHGLCAANVAACRAFDKLTPSISNRICPVDTRATQPVGFPFPLPILTSVGFPVIGRSIPLKGFRWCFSLARIQTLSPSLENLSLVHAHRKVGHKMGEFASTRKRRPSRTNIGPGRKKGKK